jgi:tetratricopeptide (TPR) repeat protein
MLETIRQFALGQAAQRSDRSTVLQRHVDAYLAMAEAAASELGTSGQATAVARLAADRDNVRAAVRASIERGDHEAGLRFAAAMARFWWLWGQMEEGRSTLETILSMPSADVPSLSRMRALEAAGLLPYYGGDNERAIAMYRGQLDLARQLGDRRGEADALFNLLFTSGLVDVPADSLSRIDEVDQIYRELGDERSLARTMWSRSNLLWAKGRQAESREMLEQVILRLREQDDLEYLVMATGSMSAFSLQLGDREGAARWFLETLKVGRELGDAPAITIALPLLAGAIFELAGPGPAVTIMGAYEGLSKRYGVTMPPGLAQAVDLLGLPDLANGPLDAVTYREAFERGRAMDFDEIVTFIIETTPGSRPSREGP